MNDAHCGIPALGQSAISLNHAYTLVSKAFEPRRRANTGNVFHRVYFRRDDGRWAPLDFRRTHVEWIWSLRFRFFLLLPRVGIKSHVHLFVDPQLSLFSRHQACRDAISPILQPLNDLLARHHDTYRHDLLDIPQYSSGPDPGGFWPRVYEEASLMGELEGWRMEGEGFHLLFADLLCLTERALAQFDLFEEPGAAELLSYCVGVLTDAWQRGLSQQIDMVRALKALDSTKPSANCCELCGQNFGGGSLCVEGYVAVGGRLGHHVHRLLLSTRIRDWLGCRPAVPATVEWQLAARGWLQSRWRRRESGAKLITHSLALSNPVAAVAVMG